MTPTIGNDLAELGWDDGLEAAFVEWTAEPRSAPPCRRG